MDINAYRRKIEQSVAKAEAAASKSASRTRAADPQGIIANKKTPAKTRVEALGRATQAEGPDAVPETALRRLADPKESADVRLAAIKLLQQMQFFSSVAAEWRPAFVDALRTAVRDRKVRPAALEVLSLFKDRVTQEQLLEGIRKPAKALVPLNEALRLLSTDVHADVVNVAKKVTDTPQLRRNKAAFVQAVRILAADPSSVGKLQEVVGNNAYAMDARRVAATAISHLSPDALQKTEDSLQGVAAPRAAGRRRGGKRAAAPKAPAKPKGALAKHLETLRRVRG
jgi:hypothetical protein